MVKEQRKLSDIIDKVLKVRDEEISYDRSDILNLINLYLNGKIDESSFENSYYIMYTRDGVISMSKEERIILDDLGDIIHRFSEFKEDHELNPRAFSTIDEVRMKIEETKDKLNKLGVVF